MLIQEKIFIKLTSKTVGRFKRKGYNIPTKIDNRGRIKSDFDIKLEVLVEDLSIHSEELVVCRCDICEGDFLIKYKDLFKSNGERNYIAESHYKCIKPYLNIPDTQYLEYKSKAKHRGLKFELHEFEFLDIVTRKCHYCGKYSQNSKHKFRNGIDRLDSSIPYILDNCIPCCKTCNMMKMDLPYDIFLKHIEKIYNNKVVDINNVDKDTN